MFVHTVSDVMTFNLTFNYNPLNNSPSNLSNSNIHISSWLTPQCNLAVLNNDKSIIISKNALKCGFNFNNIAMYSREALDAFNNSKCPYSKQSLMRHHPFTNNKSFPIYYKISKSGSSSMKAFLENTNYEKGTRMRNYKTKYTNHKIIGTECIFTFVRSPIDRLISAYYTINFKLWKTLNQSFENLINDNKEYFVSKIGKKHIWQFMFVKGEPTRFQTFVDELISEPARFTKTYHILASISHILSYNKAYDNIKFIGKVETFQKDVNSLMRSSICFEYFKHAPNDMKKWYSHVRKMNGFGWKMPYIPYDNPGKMIKFHNFIEWMSLHPIQHFYNAYKVRGNINLILPPVYYAINEIYYNRIVNYYIQDLICLDYENELNFNYFQTKINGYVNIYQDVITDDTLKHKNNAFFNHFDMLYNHSINWDNNTFYKYLIGKNNKISMISINNKNVTIKHKLINILNNNLNTNDEYYMDNHPYLLPPITQAYALRNKKILYLEIPKTGCTVFKSLFIGLLHNIFYGLGKYYLNEDVHRLPYLKRDYVIVENTTEYIQLIKNENWTKIVVIRDPLERFLSAFLDKCITFNRNQIKQFEMNNISYNNHRKWNWCSMFDPTLTETEMFEKFVNEMKPFIESNIPWNPQSERHFGLQSSLGFIDIYLPYFDYILFYNKDTIQNATKLMLKEMNYSKYFYHWSPQWRSNGKNMVDESKDFVMFGKYSQHSSSTSKVSQTDKMSKFYKDKTVLTKVKDFFRKDYEFLPPDHPDLYLI